MQRWFRRAGGLLLLAFLFVALAWLNPSGYLLTADGERVHVIDGDSMRMGGRVIRLADMDAVELHQTCLDADGQRWNCGNDARDALEQLVAAGGLECRSRTSDRYGRAIAECSVDGVQDLAAAMVSLGWAVSGDVRRAGIYASEQKRARDARLGIWRGTFEHPPAWRKANPRDD